MACFAARPVRRRASSTISPYEALCIMVDDGACQVLDKSCRLPLLIHSWVCSVTEYLFSLLRDNRRETNIER